jgi:hypothetical protein
LLVEGKNRGSNYIMRQCNEKNINPHTCFLMPDSLSQAAGTHFDFPASVIVEKGSSRANGAPSNKCAYASLPMP